MNLFYKNNNKAVKGSAFLTFRKDSRGKTMASSADVRDIMGLGGGPGGSGEITREMVLGQPKKSYSKKPEGQKRPEGMARELYNLLYSDNKDAPPIIPSDTTISTDKGYPTPNLTLFCHQSEKCRLLGTSR